MNTRENKTPRERQEDVLRKLNRKENVLKGIFSKTFYEVGDKEIIKSLFKHGMIRKKDADVSKKKGFKKIKQILLITKQGKNFLAKPKSK